MSNIRALQSRCHEQVTFASASTHKAAHVNIHYKARIVGCVFDFEWNQSPKLKNQRIDNGIDL